MSVGKRFEGELRKAFLGRHPEAYVERNPDKMVGKSKFSVPSPPDLIVNCRAGNYLIECKVVKGISLPLSRLSDHQHDYLMRYEMIGGSHHGYVATLFYNGQRGSGRKHDAWLIPISYWSKYQTKHPRKSLAMKHCLADLERFRMRWIPAEGWELPAWI